MGKYSVENINIDNIYTGNLVSVTMSGTASVDLSLSNMYKISMSDDLTLNYDTAKETTYNFLIETNGHTFTLGDDYRTVDGETISFTASSIISGIYDGTEMWVSHVENII